MIFNLEQVPDEVWGEYLFARDILTEKISEEQKRQMIAASVRCGYETAEKIKKQYSGMGVKEILDAESVHLVHQEEERIGNRILFALYQSPGAIMLMDGPIERIKNEEQIPQEFRDKISDLILGHELYHHIECHDTEIYTQKTRISLWKFLFYEHKSNVRTTSEIAAMCFSRAINEVDYPTFLLDILLIYVYDKNQAIEMYQEVMALNDNSA